MPLLCKQKALYVKGCVIPNGITDSQGDCLNAEEIKRIFTSFNNQDNFEVLHNDLALQEVSLLENYISTANESIGTLIVPAGSWNCVIRVDNPEIKEKLLTGELGGLSLSNRIAERCKANLRGTIRYKDVKDAECIIPKWISFVESGSNGYPLHVMDYDVYILKSKTVEFEEENGGKIMDFKEFLTGLKSLIKEAEAPAEEEPAIEKEDEKTEEEKVEETPTEEPVEEETTEEEPTVEKAVEDEEAETETEEPEIEKAEETPVEEEAEEPTLEERVAKLEEAIAKLTAEPEEEEAAEEEVVEEEEVVDEDTPKITKSEKVVITESTAPKSSNYYEMTGRDPLTGLKIRK